MKAALDYARTSLGAVAARVTATESMTLEDALGEQVRYAGNRMPEWDQSDRGRMVWLVRIEADRFVGPDGAPLCQSCASTTTALLTVDARSGGILWSAVGTAERGEQIFPTGPRGEDPDRARERPSEDAMVAAALEHLRGADAIAGGDPEVVFAQPMAAGDISRLIGIGNYSPICWRPMYLVVLHGEFDAARLAREHPWDHS